jgi:hypothetical protein
LAPISDRTDDSAREFCRDRTSQLPATTPLSLRFPTKPAFPIGKPRSRRFDHDRDGVRHQYAYVIHHDHENHLEPCPVSALSTGLERGQGQAVRDRAGAQLFETVLETLIDLRSRFEVDIGRRLRGPATDTDRPSDVDREWI